MVGRTMTFLTWNPRREPDAYVWTRGRGLLYRRRRGMHVYIHVNTSINDYDDGELQVITARMLPHLVSAATLKPAM